MNIHLPYRTRRPSNAVMAFSRQRGGLMALLMPALFAACQADLTSPAPASRAAARVAQRATPRGRSAEALLRQLGERTPTFGGFFYDADGNLVVNVTSLSAAPRAVIRDAVQALLTRPRRGRKALAPRQLLFRQAAFAFPVLSAWRDTLLRLNGSVDGFKSIGIRHATNRVEIQVTSPEALAAISATVERLGIPRAGVSITIAPEERDFVDSLTTFVPAFGGGLQITGYYSWYSPVGLCTMGWNTYTGTAFVTASHCTAVRGPEPATSSTAFYQPDIYRGAYIGHEINDPPFFSAADDGNCPVFAYVCRYSDAAVIGYTAAMAPGAAGQGRIWPTTWSTSYGPGSLAIDPDATLTVIDEAGTAVEGEELDKIGAATGWTYGQVSMVCEDVRVANQYYYLCQTRVNGYASEGDSGSPVFRYNIDGTATMYGLLRGGVTGADYHFSPMDATESELGASPSYQY